MKGTNAMIFDSKNDSERRSISGYSNALFTLDYHLGYLSTITISPTVWELPEQERDAELALLIRLLLTEKIK